MHGVACGDETYRFHAGAPSLDHYLAATDELSARINQRLSALGLAPLTLAGAPQPVRISPRNPEKIVLAYGDELLQMARTRTDIVVMDGDLLSDCGIEAFKAELPERFIECGIAEQHMVSAAGGLALRGMLPVVHSFACFLTTRANEQIYNNATERTKIIYVGTLAGRDSRRSRTLASVGARYLGHRLRAWPDRHRAVQRTRGPARDPLGGRRKRGEHLSAFRQRAARSAVHAAGVVLRFRTDAVSCCGRAPTSRSSATVRCCCPTRGGRPTARRRGHPGGRDQPAVAQSNRRRLGGRDAPAASRSSSRSTTTT